jgi:hypothetical protein
MTERCCHNSQPFAPGAPSSVHDSYGPFGKVLAIGRCRVVAGSGAVWAVELGQDGEDPAMAVFALGNVEFGEDVAGSQ